jgi:signal transduction histidine kinase
MRTSKLPLRLRLTLLTTLVLTVVCALLTLSSVVTYQNYTVRPGMAPVEFKGTAINFTKASILYMIVMITAGSVASWFMAGKALMPVSNLSKRIESIDENRLFEPLTGFDANDEVKGLAISFNHLLVKLEKAFLQQKRFAANAAHELKTPLASIITNIEVLQMDDAPAIQDCLKVLENTLVNAQRLSDLVNDMLRMNNALDADHCERFDVQQMFDEIIFSLSQNIEQKKIRMENHTAGVMLSGEKALLTRAFFNLVQNAVKYNKENGEVVISSAQNGRETTFVIRDTGIGIPQDELENIFEPFYRVDLSRSRETGGSGLGLAIAKSILEKHHGRISIESKVGSFSKITVVLPEI